MKIKTFVFGLSIAASSFSFSASDNSANSLNQCELTCHLYAGSSLQACLKSCEGYTGNSCTTVTRTSYNQSCMDSVISACEYARNSTQACIEERKVRCEETVTEQVCN